jgi:hypothetical protein
MANKGLWVRVMMFNATFNSIPVMLWRSVLLVEETGHNWNTVESGIKHHNPNP